LTGEYQQDSSSKPPPAPRGHLLAYRSALDRRPVKSTDSRKAAARGREPSNPTNRVTPLPPNRQPARTVSFMRWLGADDLQQSVDDLPQFLGSRPTDALADALDGEGTDLTDLDP
jgi:hypothetical protein